MPGFVQLELQQQATGAEPGGQQYPVVVEHYRLRAFGRPAFPLVLPQEAAVGGIVGRNTAGVEGQYLPLSAEGRERWRTVTRIVGPGAPRG